ncbi:MAG: hypothetical protein ACP5D0_02110 [Hydrogenovibrio sp.]
MKKLPPNAREVACDLMSEHSLGELLVAWQTNEPDKALLSPKKVPFNQWQAILKAALLAKCTYFIPNPEFQPEEKAFLIQVACMSAGYPVSHFDSQEIMEMAHQEMPVFHQWLKQLEEV